MILSVCNCNLWPQEEKLYEIFLPKVALRIQYLHSCRHNADTKGHHTEPFHCFIRTLTINLSLNILCTTFETDEINNVTFSFKYSKFDPPQTTRNCNSMDLLLLKIMP